MTEMERISIRELSKEDREVAAELVKNSDHLMFIGGYAVTKEKEEAEEACRIIDEAMEQTFYYCGREDIKGGMRIRIPDDDIRVGNDIFPAGHIIYDSCGMGDIIRMDEGVRKFIWRRMDEDLEDDMPEDEDVYVRAAEIIRRKFYG